MVEDEVTNLLNISDKDARKFSIINLKTWAKVVKIHDGDTIHLVLYFNGEMFKITSRILGIDTAEINTDDMREKEYGIKARDRMIGLIQDKILWVHILSSDDKYGRYLTNLYTDDTESISIADILLSEDLAYEYDGGTKREFNDWHPIK